MIEALQVAYYYYRTRQHQRFPSREALEHWQQEQLVRTLRRATRRFPFYAKFLGCPYADFPIVTKQVFIDQFEAMNALGISLSSALDVAMQAERSRHFTPLLGKTAVGLSSGTSGTRSVFLVQRAERLRWAGTVLAKMLPGSLLRKHRIAFLFRANNRLYTTVKSSRIQFRYFDLLQPFEQLLKELQLFAPELLIGPSHVLDQVAQAQLAGQIHLQPARVIAVAEVLEVHARQRLKAAFGRPIHQIYQATEGFLATTCAYGTLHLHEDLLYCERQPVDDSGRRFIPIITDFYRQTQAILRYRLTDLLILRETRCPCGSVFTALDQIEGRSDDVLFLPSQTHKEKLRPVFPDVLRSAIAKSGLPFEEFQLLQMNHRTLVLRIRGASVEHHAIGFVASLEQLCRQLDVMVPDIHLESGLKIPLSEKFRRIQRQCVIPEVNL